MKQYSKLFELEGIKLVFDDESIDLIADKAMEYKLGARGLRSLCEAILTDAMYELPSHKDVKEFVVDKLYVEDKLNKNAKYIVHCRTNHRSGIAVNHMIQNGFKNIYQMMDGWSGWSMNNLTVQK